MRMIDLKCVDFRLGFLQVIWVTVLSLWIWRWLVTYWQCARAPEEIMFDMTDDPTRPFWYVCDGWMAQ